MTTAIAFRRPQGSIPMPSSDRYKGAFGVRSESSDAIYKISFDTSVGAWACSCRGNITHGHCKHLDANGLKGRSQARGQSLPVFVD